jgi:hypothetical protein
LVPLVLEFSGMRLKKVALRRQRSQIDWLAVKMTLVQGRILPVASIRVEGYCQNTAGQAIINATLIN